MAAVGLRKRRKASHGSRLLWCLGALLFLGMGFWKTCPSLIGPAFVPGSQAGGVEDTVSQADTVPRRQVVSSGPIVASSAIAPSMPQHASAKSKYLPTGPPFEAIVEVELNGDGPPEEGTFIIQITPEWAPRGVLQFVKLTNQTWYDGSAFFRVLPGFIAQFGLPAEPKPRLPFIYDDPYRFIGNKKGTVAFAASGAYSRSCQVFINLVDNFQLDRENFVPFGEVVAGWDVVEKLYGGYDDAPKQYRLLQRGNKYLEEEFPKVSKIKKITLRGEIPPPDPDETFEKQFAL